jgi:hypothetical protein
MMLALIVLCFGSMVVSGLLGYVNASTLAHAKAVDRMEARYAADAGVECLAARILNGDIIGTGVDVYNGGSVNGLTPVVIVDSITLNTPQSGINQYVLRSSAGGKTINATIQHYPDASQVRVDVWDLN